ncbi:MAG: FGGY-family carbohydrate kinase [Candidatus Bathyarchaeia archaeon]
MSNLLGVDIGTSACKAVLVDPLGRILSSSRVSNEVSFPKPGWAEQDPERNWWIAFKRAVRACLKGAEGRDIACVGISGLSTNLTPLDGRGRPLRKSILYMDTRAAAEIDHLKAELGDERFLEINGNPISHRMLAPKILWFKRHEPKLFERTERIAPSSHCYVLNKLTGSFASDYYVADMTGLSDVRKGEWSDELCEAVGIDPAMLPELVEAGSVVGEVSGAAAKEVGLAKGTPVVAGSCDANVSALSAGVIEDGESMLSYGSVGAAYTCISRPIIHRGLYFGHHVRPGKWVSAIAMQTVGAIVEWFRRLRGKREGDLRELEERAARIPPGSEGIIVLPYFMGERSPIMDPKAKGMIFGLNLYHTDAHVYRAILEAFGYGLLHHLEIYAELGVRIKGWVAVDGGAKSRLWRKIVTDATGITQRYDPRNPGAPLGDAFLAGIGCGAIGSWRAIKGWIRAGEVTRPSKSAHAEYLRLYRSYRNLYELTKEEMWRLSAAGPSRPRH